MATSFIEKMARDFDQLLMEQHRQAMECRDVQDAVGVGTDLAVRIRKDFDVDAPVTGELNISLQNLCRLVLRTLTIAREMANDFCGRGFEIIGLDELDAAALHLREMLCVLIDSADADSSSLPEVEQKDASTVPDSWFDEDHSGLRGPFA